MSDTSEQMLNAIHEIRDLLRLIAEPQIAARDQKAREELLKIVGKSPVKAKSVLLMNGSLTQADIRKKTGMDRGNLSTLVKRLDKSKLLAGPPKQPRLTISVIPDLFETPKNQS
jgi:DNA-binding MarR family transcriptional regulator